MEDIFRSATEHVLAHCAEDVDLFHKYINPGHRVSHKEQPYNNTRFPVLTSLKCCELIYYDLIFCLYICLYITSIFYMQLKHTVDAMLKKKFPV